MTFKKVLLNTCQEEFEGTHEAREVRPLRSLLHITPSQQPSWQYLASQTLLLGPAGKSCIRAGLLAHVPQAWGTGKV